jgi:hypothetical protein
MGMEAQDPGNRRIENAKKRIAGRPAETGKMGVDLMG